MANKTITTPSRRNQSLIPAHILMDKRRIGWLFVCILAAKTVKLSPPVTYQFYCVNYYTANDKEDHYHFLL